MDSGVGGVLGFFVDFEFYMAVLGVGRVSIGLVAPLRFKWLDSQPDTSNMGPVWTDFHDFEHFQKSCRGFLARYLQCFRPGAPKTGFSSFMTGTKKMRDEKLCRFVAESPREVPSFAFSCSFKIFIFRSFLKAPPFCLFPFREFSVH